MEEMSIRHSRFRHAHKAIGLFILHAAKEMEITMRYVLLIYGVEAEYANMSPQEHAALMRGHALFAEETQKSDQLKGGAPLQPTRTASTVRVRQGKLMV